MEIKCQHCGHVDRAIFSAGVWVCVHCAKVIGETGPVLTPLEEKNRKRANKLKKIIAQMRKIEEEVREEDASYEGRNARVQIGKAMDSTLIAANYLTGDW